MDSTFIKTSLRLLILRPSGKDGPGASSAQACCCEPGHGSRYSGEVANWNQGRGFYARMARCATDNSQCHKGVRPVVSNAFSRVPAECSLPPYETGYGSNYSTPSLHLSCREGALPTALFPRVC